MHTCGTGIYLVVQGDGKALQEDGTFGDDARTFDDLQQARAARPGHFDGTATSRVIFTSQWRKFATCGCLK
jgi:hypothetical protein